MNKQLISSEEKRDVSIYFKSNIKQLFYII